LKIEKNNCFDLISGGNDAEKAFEARKNSIEPIILNRVKHTVFCTILFL
jgi:hypothetical protein